MHGEPEITSPGHGRESGALAGADDESREESAGRGLRGWGAAVGGLDAADGGEILRYVPLACVPMNSMPLFSDTPESIPYRARSHSCVEGAWRNVLHSVPFTVH